MASYAMLEELAGYVGFDAEDQRLLGELRPWLEPHFDRITDVFYDAIRATPEALAVFENEAQIERQKRFLRGWLEGIVGGTYDAAYFERRARIGRVHLRIRLPQRYMFGAMNILRRELHAGIDEAGAEQNWSRSHRDRSHTAIDRICDLELAIMLETYREDYTQRLRATERLATLGQLAASIGHELRNPLAVIETSVHLLTRRLKDDARSARHVDRIHQQVRLCSQIISDLLELARDRPVMPQPTSLRELVQSAVANSMVPESVSIALDLPDEPTLIDVDPGQLRQLLTNLLSNAVQSVQEAERSDVVVRARRYPDRVELTVEDDGVGLSEEALARLFEPLFTTRSRGIGLGLALCQRIAAKHGGTIRGENRPERGASFEVVLPQRAPTSDPSEEAA